MPSKFTEHPSEADRDQSLFLILDKDGNFSADKENLERLLKNKKFPIKIVRMDTNLDGNSSREGNNDEPQIQLTVDDITPDNEKNETDEKSKTNETDEKTKTIETVEKSKTDETDEKSKTDETVEKRKTDETDEKSKTNETVENSKTDETDQKSKTDETDKTNEPNETNKTNEPNETNKTSELNETNKTSELNETNKTNEPNETNKTSEPNERNKTNEPNESNKTNETNEPNEANEPKATNEPNETNEPKATNEPNVTNTTNTTGEQNTPAVQADPSNSLVSSSLDILPSTSAETSTQETADPFSEMNPEQLQRLEHALASEQAKLILGENVAVIRDMLSVDEFCGSFLQKSIENDHCYTNLLPSSDPNGPSPFVADVRVHMIENAETNKNTNGNSGMGNQSNRRVNNIGNTPDRQLPVDGPQLLTVEVHHGADESEDESVQPEPEPIPGPSYVEDISFEDIPSETSEEEDDDTSDEDYTDRSGKKRKKKPKRAKKAAAKKQALSRGTSRPTARQVRTNSRPRSYQEVQKKTERSNDEVPEVMQSMSSSSKSEETKSEPTKDKGKDSGKSSGKDKKTGPKRKRSREESVVEEPQVVESQVLPGETASASKPPPAKQPKKENKRGHTHRAEAFGPALFSAPDIIRRVPVAEELPQTTPEKRNFTVGAQKSILHKEGESSRPPERRRPTVTFQPGVSILGGPAKSPSASVTKPKSLLKKPRIEVVPQPPAETVPEIEVVSAPQPEAETTPKLKSESTKSKTESAAKSKPESTPKSKSDSGAKSKPESTPESKSDSTPETNPDCASKSNTEGNPDSKTESVSKPKSDPPPKSKSDSAPKPRSEAAPKQKTESTTKSKAESAHKSKTESNSKSKAEPSRKTKTKTFPKSKAESARRSKSESTSKSKAKSFLQPQTESTPQHKAESAPKKKGESACQPKTESTPQRKVGSTPQRDVNSTPQPEAECVPQPEVQNKHRHRAASQHRVAAQRVEERPVQPSVSGEVAGQPYTTNIHIQRILDEHHRQQRFRRYRDDFQSDGNVNDNYELDPTQMDQSLLETVARQNYRTETQRLHEALVLQEQSIGSGTSSEPRPRKSRSEINLDDSLKDVVDVILGELEAQEIERNKSEEETLTVRDPPRVEPINEPRMSRSDDDDLAQPSTSGLGNSKTNGDKTEDENGPSEEGSEYDSDMDDALSEASWNSEDDPDRLWCVCRKPHNNRFMICCDSCEEWFHGKCVGITKSIGRQMEIDGLEWSCPRCILRRNGVSTDEDEDEDEGEEAEEDDEEHEEEEEEEEEHEEEEEEKGEEEKEDKEDKEDKGEEEENAPQNNNEEEVIQDQEEPERERSVPLEEEQNESRDVEVSERDGEKSDDDYFYQRQCIMCNVFVRDRSLYCGDACLRKHSQIALTQLRAEAGTRRDPEAPGPSSQPDDEEEEENTPENPRIIVMDTDARKVLVGPEAPTVANLVSWLRENPSYQVVYKKSQKTGQYIVTSQRVIKIAKRRIERAPRGEGSAQEPEAVREPEIAREPEAVGEPETAREPQANLPASQSARQGTAAQPPANTGRRQIYEIFSHPTAAGSSRQPTATIIVRQRQSEESDSSSVVVKGAAPKPSTKATTVKITVAPDDSDPAKGDKMSRKKKDKDKAPAGGVPNKDLRQGPEKPEEEKDKEVEPEKKDANQKIRAAIRKTLKESLKTRVGTNHLDYSDDYVENLANEIEQQLFLCFEKVDTKYKSRYRSLFFNIKDIKNPTLFRKVLDGSITPKELVRLSPEDLASPELARWREKENQHQLEMIKKSELELMTIGNTYIMKSHKGEQVIENVGSERAAAVAAEIDPNTPAQDLVSALNSVASTSAKQDDEVVQDLSDDDSKEKALDGEVELEAEGAEEAELMQDGSIPGTEEVAEEEEEEEDEDEQEDQGDEYNNRNKDDKDEDDPDPAPTRGRRDSRHQGSRGRESRRKSPRRDRDRKRGRSRSRSRSRRHRSSDKRARDGDKSRHRHRDKKSRRGKRDSSDSRDSRDSSESRDSKDTRGSINSRDSRGSRSESSSDRNERNEGVKARDDERTHIRPADEDADHESSSTVGIKTPDINTEGPDPELEPESELGPVSVSASDPNQILEPTPGPEPEPDPEPQAEPSYVWKGIVTMPEVAKFWAIARAVSGNCARLAIDIGDKMEIVGRIAHVTVWDYIYKMRKMPTRDVILIKILPSNENEKTGYSTLYSYLSRRNRMAVVGKTSDVVKDFYLYAWNSRYPLPQALLSLSGYGLEDERGENRILGIVVRSKRRMLQQRSLSNEVSTSKPDAESVKLPERSFTPPLPDEDKFKKDPRLKKKIRVQVDFNKSPAHDDGDSPYSPGDSDEDLTPLPKIPKLTTPDISAQLQKFLSTASTPENLKDPVEIQRKIEEMNRAIEEQTQQIQSLTSAVPMLTANVPLPNISLIPTPLLSNASAGVLTILPKLSVTKPSPEIEELPIKSAEQGERPRSPPGSFTPMRMEEKIPFLPEEQNNFTSPSRKEEEGGKRVTLPPNLQEILNSINKKSGPETNEAKTLPDPAKAVEEIVKSNTPDINMALNVLTQTKSLLHSLSSISGSKESAEKSDESTPILSRLSDEDIIRKAKEMEELTHGDKDFPPSVACPSRPLPPVVPDIPVRTSGDAYGFNLAPSMFPHGMEDKSAMDVDERKQKKFRLDPKSVFEKEGVPDFVASSTSPWDDKQKQSRYKIDIKLSMPSPDQQNDDGECFEADSASTSKLDEERKAPDSSRNIADEYKYDVDERVMKSKGEERPRGMQDDRRRRNEDWEAKRDWKYGRGNWEDPRRFNKGDYNRRHGGKHYGGPKFRKDRFEDKRDRHLEKEWEGSIKDFEERQRRRNLEIRKEEVKRLRKRSDSSSN